MCLPRHPKGKRAEGTYKQWRCTGCVVFEKFSFSLESATVSYLRSLQFAIFGRRLLPFLVVAVWLFFFFFLNISKGFVSDFQMELQLLEMLRKKKKKKPKTKVLVSPEVYAYPHS